MKTYGETRGYRNHNPCNVRPCPLPNVWDGQVGIDKDLGGPFAIFGDTDGTGHFNNKLQEADFWGLRAGARNFRNYQLRDGCDTMGKIIARHAPQSDHNDTSEYVNFVCGRLGVAPRKKVDLTSDHDLMLKLIKAVVNEEEGVDNYPDALIVAAIAAA